MSTSSGNRENENGRESDGHRAHHHGAAMWMLVVAAAVVLVAGFAAVDMIPVITREGRVKKFEELAKPGDPWAEVRLKLESSNYILPAPPENPVQIVRMDSRTPTLLKGAYMFVPSRFRKFLPAAYRDAWVSVNALGEIHNVRVLRPGYTMSMPLSYTALTTSPLWRRMAAGNAQGTTLTKITTPPL
ncbi:MAG: hypothetical protein ACR2IE_05300 [Candidatus Sumerlaeaceae bacterium]